MSRLLCCLCARTPDMGAALSHVQEGEACDAAGLGVAPPTMADVIRERKKKAGGAGLGTLRRRLAAAARRPLPSRPDRGCEHARFIRSVVSGWRVAEVVVVCEALEAGAALRDLTTQADLAREPAPALHVDLLHAYRARWWCDVELVGSGYSLLAHRALLSSRCAYFRGLLARHGGRRVPLDGAAADLNREELDTVLLQLYSGAKRTCPHTAKWERGSDGDLDIISGDSSGSLRSRSGRCTCARGAGSSARRLGALLGYSADTLHTDMRYLLDSGEYADSRLVFRLESGGCGAAYGFRAALDLPCHRLVLAARSRFFRSVMSRRTSSPGSGGPCGGGGGAAVCVDEKVLPRRFARALLHAAYTDQVDLTLIGRGSTSPSATTASNTSSWSGVRSGPRPASAAALEDAFQLYEIARFLEMAIVVQGCEDAIIEALTPDTLPLVLRWAAAPHASQWVHRQAMRYLRDEFPCIMSSAGSARLPRPALSDALSSPFLQASEAQCLRALLQGREAGGGGGAGRWRREGGGAGAGAAGAGRELAQLVRLEHLPHDHDLIHQAVRRGLLETPPAPDECNSADAWLGRGSYRPPRYFLPYLDELKALLVGQPVPEAEVACVRRTRLTHRIPDTLYMVAAARSGSTEPAAGLAAGSGAAAAAPGEALCVSPRLLAAVRTRCRELLVAPPAARALLLPAIDTNAVYRQIGLRAVRELSLPDGCAELVLAELEQARASAQPARPANLDRESVSGEGAGFGEDGWDEQASNDCCRRAGSVSRCPSAGSGRGTVDLHVSAESSRAGTCRRELSSRPDSTPHRSVNPEWFPSPGGSGLPSAALGASAPPGAAGPRGRLSMAVPDVAMAPNANTHLLTALDYCRHPTHHEYSSGVLQLDLGDGATHTPRPGSRALRAALGAERARCRDPAAAAAAAAAAAHAHPLHAPLHPPHPAYAQGACSSVGSVRGRPDEDELRAALELSVMRAYSSLSGGGGGGAGGAATLPHAFRPDLPAYIAALRSRASASPSPSAGLARPDLAPAAAPAHGSDPRLAGSLRRADSGRAAEGAGGAGGAGGSPRRGRPQPPAYRHDYRLDPSYGGGGSRGHSPNNYA